MPIPNTPGDGTPGSSNVTLYANEWFYLPLWTLVGTSYTNGLPPDEVWSNKIFKTLDITLKIDGVPVVTTANVMNYYSKADFDPEIPLGFDILDTALFVQSISILHAPLAAGNHTITLGVENTIPVPIPVEPFEVTITYHNTWNIQVLP